MMTKTRWKFAKRTRRRATDWTASSGGSGKTNAGAASRRRCSRYGWESRSSTGSTEWPQQRMRSYFAPRSVGSSSNRTASY